MNLQVTQENLSKALGSVARVANTRNTLPILSNVMIKTVGTRLTIAATNLDIAITHFIGAKVSKEGSITVPARLMNEFINTLPSGVIKLTLEEHKLHISTDKYQSIINGVSAEDFPVMPAITKGSTWTIPAKILKTGLQQVIFAASTDESRPVLTGIYFHTVNNSLFLAATDSYRLAEKELMKTKENINLLVPLTAMQDVLRILADFEDDVEIINDDQQVLFRIGDIELVARLIDGTYPDYQKLIPQKHEITAQLKKVDLVNITKVSSLFARESAGSVTVDIEENQKLVSIRSVASQLGENTATADANTTGSGSITLNSKYLLDGLHAIEGEEVLFGFNGKLEACVIKPTKNTNYVHVIMPLKS